jgi:hypothetical protein
MNEPTYFDSALTSAEVVQEILHLNEVIAEIVYGEDKSGLPVHLDLDDDSFESNKLLHGITPQEFRDQLVSNVGRVHKNNDLLKVFSEFGEATRRWVRKGDFLTTPPALSLLAVLSIAADEMEAEENISSSNYYLRLSKVLARSGGIAPDPTKLGNHYRKEAVELWESLVTWLEAWQGDRGIPTVPLPGDSTNADGREYIRMPISQALLRESDRTNLYKMFSVNNLDPAMSASEELMSHLLGRWSMSSHATSQLEKLWKVTDYRESLILLVISTLDKWPGVEVESNGVTTTSSKVGLTLVLDKWMNRAEFGIEIRYAGSKSPNEIEIRTADDSFTRSMVVPAGHKSVRIADLSAFETSSLIDGIIEIKNEDFNLKGQRRPRAIVPMAFQQASNEYIEVAGVTLGSDHGLLVRNSTKHDLETKVRELLTDVARPGWSEVDTSRFVGFPQEWTLFQNVNIMVPFEVQYQFLEVLIPLEAPSIQLSNGFKIPGRRERWLRSAPPEIFAVVPRETDVKILITNSEGEVVAETTPTPRASLIELNKHELPTGSYRATIKSGDGETFKSTFTLVDADTPNPTALHRPKPLGHLLEPNKGFASVSAERIESPDQVTVLQGLRHATLSAPDVLTSVSEIPTAQMWRAKLEAPSQPSGAKLSVTHAPKDACVSTGAHIMIYPTWYGKSTDGLIKGVCKFCGLTKKSPAKGVLKPELRQSINTAKKSISTIKDATPSTKNLAPLVQALPPIEIQEFGAWDNIFEALCYLRQGSVTDLEAVSARLSGGSVGVERLVRYLSALGHIDVEMNERVRPLQWAISPAVIVETSQNEAHLAGFRSSQLLSLIAECITPHHGEIKRYENLNAPATISISFPPESNTDLDSIFVGVLDPITQQQIQISRSSCRAILQQCAPISKVIEDSPQVSRPNFSQVNIWRPEFGMWEKCDSNNMPGAFQHIGHGYSYTFNESEIGLGDLTTAGSPSTVKHNVSRIAGIPLIFYSPDTRVLVARLGAELPPMMNRALTSLTGRLPVEDETDFFVKYHDVPADVADFVHYLLTE